MFDAHRGHKREGYYHTHNLIHKHHPAARGFIVSYIKPLDCKRSDFASLKWTVWSTQIRFLEVNQKTLDHLFHTNECEENLFSQI